MLGGEEICTLSSRVALLQSKLFQPINNKSLLAMFVFGLNRCHVSGWVWLGAYARVLTYCCP